ncbi:MAG: DUF4157 domain-containing protein, partial [Bacteroidia bacterium]|nr:DUF4157 domain-containing protein [Bacteroidia bacterium]
PMGADTQSFMSDRFGADFSRVRIHTGSQSVQMNQELGAKAFTVGNDVHFNQGEYNPGSTEGKELLAHEITHVIQQQSARLSTRIQRVNDKPKKFILLKFPLVSKLRLN